MSLTIEMPDPNPKQLYFADICNAAGYIADGSLFQKLSGNTAWDFEEAKLVNPDKDCPVTRVNIKVTATYPE